MDGTLLNGKQEISEGNRRAIMAAQEKGVEVILATGRSYQEASHMLQKAGLRCGAICANGAEIRNREGEVLHSVGLEGEIARKMIGMLRNLGVYVELYTNEGTYTDSYQKGIDVIIDIYHTANPDTSREEIQAAAEERFKRGLIEVVDDYSEVLGREGCRVYKLLAFSMDPALLSEAAGALRKVEGVAVTSSGRENIEVTHQEAQKGIALKRFAEHSGVPLSETMAMGDNYNDLSMLKVAGRPVAMGNAEQEVKDICRYITAVNDEDGAGKAIMEAIQE